MSGERTWGLIPGYGEMKKRNRRGTPLWIVRLIENTFSLRFVLARLTHLPLIGRLLDHFLFREDEIIYIADNRSVKLNVDIDLDAAHENIVLPSDIVDHFIRAASHHWIINFCICRRSAHCQDYPVELGCLFLGEAVQGINPELGRLVSKEEALNHARMCRDAGLVHLIGRNRLDSVWLNVRPGHRLLTICNCCPCCCLWKMLPDLSRRISDNVHRMPGVVVRVNEQCNGCGACAESICFVNAIQMQDGRAFISDDCRGCGRCVNVCPNHAIEIVFNEKVDVITESIHRISTLVEL